MKTTKRFFIKPLKHPFIIWLEGLPGSGKTTFAKKLRDDLTHQGYDVEYYQEGDLHPIDFAWIAILSLKTYQGLKKTYARYADQFDLYSRRVENKVYFAYTKIRVDDADADFFKTLEAYELFRTPSLDHFLAEYRTLYKTFKSEIKPNTIYVFECVLMQNHINELLLKHNMNKSDIIAYFKTLLEPLNAIDQSLIYIEQDSVDETLKQTIETRRSKNPAYKDWIDYVVDYIEDLPYGKKKGYEGNDGAIRYFAHRQDIELSILEHFPIPTSTLCLTNNYEAVYQKLLEQVNHSLVNNR